QADDGVLWPSAPQSYGILSGGGAAVNGQFTFTANGACGGSLMARLQLQDGPADLGTLAFMFPLGKQSTVFTQNFDSVTAPALPSDWTTTTSTNGLSRWVVSSSVRDTTPNAAFADESITRGFEDLISPAISIVSSNAQLTFRNNFNTEANPSVASLTYDGGVLEIQVGTNEFS